MLTIQITTSVNTTRILLDIPGVDDAVMLHYDGCGYCDHAFRREQILVNANRYGARKYCCASHKNLMTYHGIRELTSARQTS